MRTTLSCRREIADKMLVYLKDNDIKSCDDTHELVTKISEAIDEPLFNLWKAYELLRIMARIEMNNPNGRKGFHVLDYNPLAVSLPDRPNVPVCEVKSCPILKMIKRKWGNEL
jgi:hypothetical protein